jgi:hypothetical protein
MWVYSDTFSMIIILCSMTFVLLYVFACIVIYSIEDYLKEEG